MRVERDGKVVASDDLDGKIDDSDMPRTERDGQVVHEGASVSPEAAEKKAVVEPPADKAIKTAPRKKAK